MFSTFMRRLQSSNIHPIRSQPIVHKLASLKGNPISQNVCSFRHSRYFSSSIPRDAGPRNKRPVKEHFPPEHQANTEQAHFRAKKQASYAEQTGRRSPRYRPSSTLLIWTIVGGCAYIFASYNNLNLSDHIPVLPQLKPSFLEKHFMLSERNINEGRYYTLLTNTFMHTTPLHLMCNMLSFISFATALSPAALVTVWIGSGISCSLFMLYTWRHPLPFGLNAGTFHPNTDQVAIGASGSISGIVAATVVANPSVRIGMLFIPVYFPAWAVLGAGTLYSVMAMKEGWQPNIGHAGHLGGEAFGLAFGVLSLVVGRGRF